MRRRLVSIGLVGGLVAIAAGASGAPTPTPQTGTSSTGLSLPQVTVIDPSGVSRTVTLGTISAAATTAGAALARIGLAGAQVAGTALPDWSVDNNSSVQSGDHGVPVTSPLINGGLNLAGYGVSASATDAASTLSALTGGLATGPLNSQLDLGQHGITSTVAPTTSLSELQLSSVGGAIRLGDVLPSDILNALPLSELVSLAQSLGLSVPPAVTTALTQLTNLNTTLSQLTSTATDLSAARTQLATLLAALPGTQAAQQAVTTAQTQLTSALNSLAAAQQQLAQDQATLDALQQQKAAADAAVTAAQAAVSSAQAQVNSLLALVAANPLSLLLKQQLTAAQAALTQATANLAAAQATAASLLQQVNAAQTQVAGDTTVVTTATQLASAAQSTYDAAQAALDSLAAAVAAGNQAVADAQALVTSLTTTLNTLLGNVTSAAGALPNVQTLLTTLQSLMGNVPLADLGRVVLDVKSVANDSGGTGTVTCDVTGLAVGGQATASGPCDQVAASFTSAVSALHALLTKLPTAAVPTPVLDGLQPSHNNSTTSGSDPTSTADAGITALHLGVPQVSLHAVTDAVQATLASTLSNLSTLLPNLGLADVTGTLTGTLNDLQGVVASLPDGSALAGLRTLGLDVSLAGITTGVTHNRALAATGGTLPGTGGTAPGTGSTAPGTGSTAPGSTTPGTTTPGTTTPGTTTPGTPDTSTPDTTKNPVETPSGLPFSGSDSAAELGIAAVVMLLGAHLVVFGRRRRP